MLSSKPEVFLKDSIIYTKSARIQTTYASLN